jgi:hypothetical protein
MKGQPVARTELVEERAAKLITGFGHYVQVYDQRVSFTGEQLAAHRACIALRRRAGTVRVAVNNDQFVQELQRTLRAWRIGVRASRLASSDQFATALHTALPKLEALEPFAIDADLPEDIANRLWTIIDSLGVVKNVAKIVAGTKTLHHLLPELVVPMDRRYTGAFFGFHLPEWQDPASQRRIFQLAFNNFVAVARRVDPERYVTEEAWHTSRTKILDNALIGFCKAELGDRPLSAEDIASQVSFDVAGYPPAKNEALSMLGVGHSHADRVQKLLAAADAAVRSQGFVPIDSGDVALAVVVRAPKGANRADATNYLGGIGDVLEDKSHRGPLDHLGALAGVWLYRNDRQIKQISYREAVSDEIGYTVSVRSLHSQSMEGLV